MQKAVKPVKRRILECIFKKDGFKLKGKSKKHYTYVKEGIKRPVTIPRWDEIPEFIICNNLKTAKMSRKRYFELLDECK